MDKIESIVSKLPHFYAATLDEKSVMYNFLKAFADEFDIMVNEYIERADDAIGIATTHNKDLDWRWGALVGFKRLNGESDNMYRMRLMNLINALRGGTAAAIRYAVALILGIEDDQAAMEKYIKVHDAWKYPDAYDKAYGNFVVEITFQAEEFNQKYPNGVSVDDIAAIVRIVKAAGTNHMTLFMVHLHDELIHISHTCGYLIYTPRISGTYPYRSRLGKWDHPNIVIYTHNTGIGYRNPYVGEIDAGVYPQPARYGQIVNHNLDTTVDGNWMGYMDPYTGEIVAGTFPEIMKLGKQLGADITIETSASDAAYTNPATGTRPQPARYGEIIDGTVTIKIAVDDARYTSPTAGTQPETAEYGGHKSTSVVVASPGDGQQYDVPATGEVNSGSVPEIAVQGSMESGDVGASISGEGASYGSRMCGTTLGNLF